MFSKDATMFAQLVRSTLGSTSPALGDLITVEVSRAWRRLSPPPNPLKQDPATLLGLLPGLCASLSYIVLQRLFRRPLYSIHEMPPS